METNIISTSFLKNYNTVGNLLLSERDGNPRALPIILGICSWCRKPTTLWKRWKREHGNPHPHSILIMSETYYSLKEMETTIDSENSTGFNIAIVGNLLLSERDGNSVLCWWTPHTCSPRRKPTTLWKRWKPNHIFSDILLTPSCRKPTTLWKRWKLVHFCKPLSCFDYSSETYYSLKEMETSLSWQTKPFGQSLVGNLLLSERDGNLNPSIDLKLKTLTSRKPTTLWKRWKQICIAICYATYCFIHVGNLLLSERDGNPGLHAQLLLLPLGVGNLLLSERDGN